MAFVRFMSSGVGRVLRVLVGAAIILYGWQSVGGGTGLLIALVGFVPLAAGLADFCLFGPLFGTSFNGEEIRKEAKLEKAARRADMAPGITAATGAPPVEGDDLDEESEPGAGARHTPADDHRPSAH